MLVINRLFRTLIFSVILFLTGTTVTLQAENEDKSQDKNSLIQNNTFEKQKHMMNPAMGMMNPMMGMMNPAMGMMNPMMGMMNPKQYEQWFNQQSEMMKNTSKTGGKNSAQEQADNWWKFW